MLKLCEKNGEMQIALCFCTLFFLSHLFIIGGLALLTKSQRVRLVLWFGQMTNTKQERKRETSLSAQRAPLFVSCSIGQRIGEGIRQS